MCDIVWSYVCASHEWKQADGCSWSSGQVQSLRECLGDAWNSARSGLESWHELRMNLTWLRMHRVIEFPIFLQSLTWLMYIYVAWPFETKSPVSQGASARWRGSSNRTGTQGQNLVTQDMLQRIAQPDATWKLFHAGTARRSSRCSRAAARWAPLGTCNGEFRWNCLTSQDAWAKTCSTSPTGEWALISCQKNKPWLYHVISCYIMLYHVIAWMLMIWLMIWLMYVNGDHETWSGLKPQCPAFRWLCLAPLRGWLLSGQ